MARQLRQPGMEDERGDPLNLSGGFRRGATVAHLLARARKARLIPS